jgi:hypothetical protein
MGPPDSACVPKSGAAAARMPPEEGGINLANAVHCKQNELPGREAQFVLTQER